MFRFETNQVGNQCSTYLKKSMVPRSWKSCPTNKLWYLGRLLDLLKNTVCVNVDFDYALFSHVPSGSFDRPGGDAGT